MKHWHQHRCFGGAPIIGPMSDAPFEIEAAGRELAVSNPNKIYFSERGETKLDLVRYYLAVEAPLMRALEGAPKTTGRNGIHIYVRLVPEQDSFAVRAAAVALARELERRRPDLITAAWWKEERGTRVFIDFNQNAPHKTVLGAWSVRPRAGGQVSTPFAWDELPRIAPEELTLIAVPPRVTADGDPWAMMTEHP